MIYNFACQHRTGSFPYSRLFYKYSESALLFLRYRGLSQSSNSLRAHLIFYLIQQLLLFYYLLLLLIIQQ